ncbi:MAG: ParB/RepB/Spo0J family partition protein [Alphaproteobacteria bacterium]|nr:ParB/RepB/Spo0J family partition protein [Alphaproteobacteria bacterium]
MSKKGLGRGLSALLGDDDFTENEETVSSNQEEPKRGISTLELSKLQPSPWQPRHVFDEEAINDLVESIKNRGILQPLLVRELKDEKGKYEIIGGERRWRASQKAGLTEVPVIIKDFTDQEALEVALVENLQRQDLNALEEAEGYHRLMNEFKNTQESLAKAVGKSRSHVANTMRLLQLPDSVKELLETGKLTGGHARALLNAKNPEDLAKIVIDKGLNVRQTEQLAANSEKVKPQKKKKQSSLSGDFKEIEKQISEIVKLPTLLKTKGNGGEIIISFADLEELDKFMDLISSKSFSKKEKIEEEQLETNPDEIMNKFNDDEIIVSKNENEEIIDAENNDQEVIEVNSSDEEIIK